MKLRNVVVMMFVLVMIMGVFALPIYAQEEVTDETCVANTIVATEAEDSANFVAVARYQGVNVTDRAEFVQRVHDGFLPIVQESEGFIGYILADLGEDGWLAIRLFDNEESAMASSEMAKGWVADNIADMLPEAPTVFTGRVDLRSFMVPVEAE